MKSLISKNVTKAKEEAQCCAKSSTIVAGCHD